MTFQNAVDIVCMNCTYKEGYDYDFKKKEYVKTKGEWTPPCEQCMVRVSLDKRKGD